jgi:peroxiredoxin
MRATFKYLITCMILTTAITSSQFLTAEAELSLPPKTMKVPLEVTSESALGTNDQDIGLSAGAEVPDFTVHAHNGEVVNLDVLLEDTPLLVVFYRGGWCPYCNVQIRQLTEAYPQFKQRGVFPVLISVDTIDGAALASRTYKIPFAVLSDPKLSAHTAFDVILDVDDETYKQYQGYGIDLEKWSGQSHHKIAVSSAFLVDKTGKVRWAHSAKDYKTRPSPEQLLAVIDNIEWD